jgi:hypothetical protein
MEPVDTDQSCGTAQPSRPVRDSARDWTVAGGACVEN